MGVPIGHLGTVIRLGTLEVRSPVTGEWGKGKSLEVGSETRVYRKDTGDLRSRPFRAYRTFKSVWEGSGGRD